MVELIWDGKYDEHGNRAAPPRIALPFQTVETINESAQQRERNLFTFAAQQQEWRNRLIWGDKKYVLPSLLPEFAGKVDLIYIDPPFATGANFSFQTQVGGEAFEKEPSIIEEKAYRDTFGKGNDGYYAWFYESLVLLHELLSDTGSIYVHCDWHVNAGIRFILDELFGGDNFINEITWKRTNVHSHAAQGTKHFSRVQDTIFYYSKSATKTWHQLYLSHSDKYVETNFRHIEQETGRRYSLGDLTATDGGPRGNPRFEFLGITRYWRYNLEKMEELYRQNRIIQSSPGAVPRLKRYLDETKGVEVGSLWLDIPPIASQSNERLGYATQKPEALLERIIQASSNEGDLVLDCFCGSGTTAAVAEKLQRRWITCDLGRFAIHTARKRLLGIEGVRPFIVQNLGKYERQVWQNAEFGDRAGEIISAYRRFILDLYHADPVDGLAWLHGKRGGRMVHIGTVDTPITPADVTNIAADFRRAIGSGKDAPKVAGVDVLGWDFALDMNETVRQIADAAGLDVRFVRIPREVLEKKAVEQGDIRFFELAALSVDVVVKKRDVRITLTDFMIPPDDVPDEIIKAVKHWSEWIDYWAVDFNYHGDTHQDDTFHNEWQTYRTRQDRSLQLSVNHLYAAPGEYVVLVKVIDILGNDTTKAVVVEVK